MSSTVTSTAPKSAKSQIVLSRLWWTGPLTILVAVVVNFLIATGAKSLFTVASTFTPVLATSDIRSKNASPMALPDS